jgi:hypothetical protein
MEEGTPLKHWKDCTVCQGTGEVRDYDTERWLASCHVCPDKTLNPPKACGTCTRVFDRVPDQFKFLGDPGLGGFYWECRCGSTLYHPLPLGR